MSSHPIRGKTITFHFTDSPTGEKSYEHVFHSDGSVEFGEPGSAKKAKVEHYEVAHPAADVYAVSYTGPSGWTLTSILDFATHKLVAFSSNEKQLMQSHGTFE